MLGGQLYGRITSATGIGGLTAHIRLNLEVGLRNTQAVIDLISVTGAVYFSYARKRFPTDSGAGSYIGPAYLENVGPLATLTNAGSSIWSFRVHTDHSLLHGIEQDRKGRDIILRLEVRAVGLARPSGATETAPSVAVGEVHDAASPGSSQCSIEIPKSKWLELLKDLGYGEFYLAEIPLPHIRKGKALDASLQHLQRAWEHFLNGSDREAMAACHDALEKLAKEFVNPNSKPDQNAFSSILAGIGNQEKIDKVAQLLHRWCQSHTPRQA